MINDSHRKTITFISRTPPYGSDRAQLCLDTALAAAVFDQEINYVFHSDGVLQLLNKQNADAIDCKTLGNIAETLQLYGIKNAFVDQGSLQQRDIQEGDLATGVQSIDVEGLTEIIDKSHTVFNL
ncbi:MAG TPA: sulfurtransferase complex subunit TusC [Gammaproteobacteria bacterium]|jgi:sulfur relay protein TusC/DsrF|nr:sulfurtransferase complex subunit TusC [Gammaproteobacteria bacterium]MDP6733377.1 sulfurtransferase complex subunit TusC [Gammaproteobacteria bacterium]HAJ75175.1 sulfurtransferase complex subunit TusC [Gammaproteobacteria bacterium]|tara:strand:+ start:927 stop:1301 length:375 start_codon:yes stop_codon:yes gene_type:complete